MRKNNWKNSRSKDIRIYEFETNHKVYCKNPKCSGHGVIFYDKKKDRLLCPNCNEWIYRDLQTKLKYELREKGVKIVC